MNENSAPEYIDLRVVAKKLWDSRKMFYKVLPVVFVLACAYTLCLPRYYKSSLQLVPELGGMQAGGGLADLASSFGIDLGSMQSSDAISPLLYPDLMSDNGFVANLFTIHVKSGLVNEGEDPIDTTYYAYIKSFQKSPFWTKAKNKIKRWFDVDQKGGAGAPGAFDPYYVSRKDDGIMGQMRDDINISIDKKTAVITIATQAQDPLIAKTLADSVCTRLQTFITKYRTSKATIDMEYYCQLMTDAKDEFDAAAQKFAVLKDANINIARQSRQAQLDDLETDMQMKLQNYQTMATQYEAAKAKVQERTPAFTLLKGADVPIKHSGPKRMIMVVAFMFLACIAVSAKILWPDVKKQLLR